MVEAETAERDGVSSSAWERRKRRRERVSDDRLRR